MGVVLGDAIIEEKLLHNHQDVLVGQGARNTFVVPSAALPLSFPLLLAGSDGQSYTLAFSDGMDGRLMLGGKVLTLHHVKQQGLAKKKGALWYVKLPMDAKGKVVIGDTTILFQFVNAPPGRPKAKLPAFLRGGLIQDMDPIFSTSLAGTFVVMAGLAVAFLFIDKPKNISGGRFKRLAKVAVKRQVQQLRKRKPKGEEGEKGMGEGDMGEEGDMKAEARARARGRGRGRARSRGDDGPRGPRGPARLASEDAAALADAMSTGAAVASDAGKAGFKAVALGTVCHGPNCKGAVAGGGDALSRGLSTTDLNGAAERFGAASGGGGPGGPGSGRRGGGGRGRIRGTGRVGRGIGGVRGAPGGRPRVVTPRGPRPRMRMSLPRIGGSVPASLAEKIRRKMRAKVYGLKRLYNTFLQSNKFRCSAKISFMLNKTGRVSSVSVGGNCPGNFAGAVKRKVSSWHLPSGGSGFFRISVSFTY